MKTYKNKLIVLLLIALVFPNAAFSQDSVTHEFGYEINRVMPYISISSEQLDEAKSLIDLDWRYKSDWIKEYISVEITTTHNGKEKKAIAKNNTLTQEQKELMKSADSGKEIFVIVHYIPENNLKQNEARDMTFNFVVNPQQEASYTGGQDKLLTYLKEQAIDKIPDGTFTDYDLAAVTFTVDEEGQIINPQVFWTSNDKKVDQMLLQTISNMPCWVPAEYDTGVKVKQAFAFTVGNHKSCVVKMLNIYPLPPE